MGWTPSNVDVLDDAVLDRFLGQIVGVHVADHPLQLVRGEDVAQDVENLARVVRVEIFFDRLEPLEELLQHAAFAGVGGDEVANEAVFLLAVAVDAAHPLFEPDGVPGDVVVDHEPAELEVDAFARRLGGHQDLGLVAELLFRIDAGAGCVAVADLHAAVDLRDGKPPLAELAQRTAFLAVGGEVVQRLLVLGEDQELHLRVLEDAVGGQHLAELDQLRFDFAFLQEPGLVDQPADLEDFFLERGRVNGGDHLFEGIGDLLLFFLCFDIFLFGSAPISFRK